MNITQIQRISIIDRCIRRGHPNQKDMQHAIETELEVAISFSNIDKDLKRMKDAFSAPVQYVPLTYCTGYYCYAKDYDFGNAFILYWAEYVEFNKIINKEVLC